MIAEIKVPNEQRWRKRFALFPKRIGDRRIWLERYAWRKLSDAESVKARPPRSWMLVRMHYTEFREYVLRSDGYTVWRIRDHLLIPGPPCWSTEWKRPAADIKLVHASHGRTGE